MSSRICVKNLPRYVTEERLREHFAAKGEVTDAKIIRTRDGRTRQFGFVGFRTEEEAKDATKYFHRSFFDTSRLTCELAQSIGDPNLPRPWSRHSEGSSKFKTKYDEADPTTSEHDTGMFNKTKDPKSNKFDSLLEKDSQLQEFLEVMQPRSKSKLWANDTSIGSDAVSKQRKHMKGDNTKKKVNVEMKTVETFLRRVPINKGKGGEKLTQMHVRFEGSDSDGESDDELYEEAPVLEATEILEIAGESDDVDEDLVTDDPVLRDETMTDLEYFKSRTKSGAWSDEDDEVEHRDVKLDAAKAEVADEDESDDEEESDDGQEEDEKDDGNVGDEVMKDEADKVAIAETLQDDGRDDSDLIDIADEDRGTAVAVLAEEQKSVSETGRLFVRNLPYTATEEELAELFGKFGELSEVHLVVDKTTKRSKAMAFILYMIPECAVRAMEQLDKSIFQGRLIHILPSRRPPPPPETEIMGPGSTKFKQERESQRKAAETSGNTKAWNPLFMRPDTVAENVARQYNMTKSEFLDPNADDLAVRMALGETHIIAETKRALSDEGVNIEVLEQVASGKEMKVNRSSSVILVKNLPFSTTEAELVSMFGVFGSIARVILPPTKTLALVEYLEASEGRRAFQGLAYKRFKHVPLYLEWAPVNLLTGVKKSRVAEKTEGPVGDKQLQRAVVETQVAALTEDDDVEQARSVFVKNLNFSTTEVSLKQHFQQKIFQGAVRSMTIKKKQSKSGKPLSMGFGFVEFDSVDTAKMVCQNLQGTVLDGHALVLQLSHNAKKPRGSDSRVSATKGKTESKESSTKIIVRNVAFEATRKDLLQIFNPFGQIKSMRLPKKFDGHHRGFAFVEFLTKKEAQNAFEALQNTHLYGRHMVLERAKEGESVEELRARTASQFSESNGEGPPSKRKKQANMDDSRISFGHFAE